MSFTARFRANDMTILAAPNHIKRLRFAPTIYGSLRSPSIAKAFIHEAPTQAAREAAGG